MYDNITKILNNEKQICQSVSVLCTNRRRVLPQGPVTAAKPGGYQRENTQRERPTLNRMLFYACYFEQKLDLLSVVITSPNVG